MRKKKRSKTKEKSISSPQMPKDQPLDSSVEEQKPFDFGGLPDRDLKKNLGCG